MSRRTRRDMRSLAADLADWHRVVEFIEVAHGIKGGQHGTE